MSALPHGIASLSVAQKFELLDALWEDLEAHTPPLSADQEAELQRRVAAYEQDPSSVIPWEQVSARLLGQ